MLGIAFEGCACRAAFHVGVAAALVDAKVPFGLTAGASSGSIVATALAAGLAADLPSLWRSLADRSIVSLPRALHNRSPFDMSHLVSSALRTSLGNGDLRTAPGEVLITATRLRDLATLVLSSREESDMVNVILGSCFIPVLYGRPVRLRGTLVVDGGLTDNLPVEALARRGCRQILAVVTSVAGTSNKTPIHRRWRPRAAGSDVRVVCPRRPLRVRSWDLSSASMNEAIDEGWEAGRLAVRQL